MLYCTWRALLMNVVYIKIALSIFEMLTLLTWGMTTAGGPLFDRLLWRNTRQFNSKDAENWLGEHSLNKTSYEDGSRWEHKWAYDSSANDQFKWNILAAMSLRVGFNFCWNFFSFLHRRRLAEQRYKQRKALFGYLRMVWGYGTCVGTLVNTDFIQLIVRILFLWLTSGTDKENVMTSTQQATLSVTFFMSLMNILSHFRAVASKISLSRMAMRKALEDSEVTHFLFFVAGLFTIFIFSWEIIDRESTIFDGMTQAFRGLVIGDGDGLDFLGLEKEEKKTVEQKEAHHFKNVVGTLAMIVFFSYLMNLIIAVFGNTYDNAKRFVWLHFHHGRARFLRDTVLSCHKFHFFKDFWAPSCQQLLAVSISLCLGGASLNLLVSFCEIHSACYQLASFFSILMMAAGFVLFEAYPFVNIMKGNPEHDWFPWTDNSPTDHYLHIWCRADYDEDLFLGTGDMDQKYRAMSRMMTDIHLISMGIEADMCEQKGDSGGLEKRMNQLDEKVSALDNKIEERMDALGQQMKEVVDAVGRLSSGR